MKEVPKGDPVFSLLLQKNRHSTPVPMNLLRTRGTGVLPREAMTRTRNGATVPIQVRSLEPGTPGATGVCLLGRATKKVN